MDNSKININGNDINETLQSCKATASSSEKVHLLPHYAMSDK